MSLSIIWLHQVIIVLLCFLRRSKSSYHQNNLHLIMCSYDEEIF
jgi:hypothetical protein